jgi:DNA-3-methyladenine glycosylase II
MNTEAVQHLARADKILGRLIQKVGPCALKPQNHWSPYQALVVAVAYQQLNSSAASTILGRFKALYPGRRFPKPEEVLTTPEARLRGAGLSRAKVAAIRDIAAKTVAGIVPTTRAAAKLSDTELVERLTCIRGVGPWTVEMLLIFTLGRPDVLPATDYGVRQGFAQLYGWRELPTPREVIAHGEKWRPHRSTAACYLWRVMDVP